ncbi:MAG: DNRLRE domain-containing protein [Cyclobacteriaceae bacterium]|nr:DNRLRE domain-containing protein [Cyclobacteriaceae bacterium]
MKNLKILLSLSAFWLLLCIGVSTAHAQSAVNVYLPIDDAIAHQSYADSTFDKNNGNLKALNVPIGDSVAWVVSFVKFDISQLKGQVVESATVSIRGSSANKEAMQLELYNSKSEEWTRETLTYANKPARDKKIGTYTFGTGSDRKAFDPTTTFLDKLNQALAEGKTTFSMEIRSTAKDTLAYGDTWIGGKKDGFNYGPRLEIQAVPKFGVKNDTLMVLEDVYLAQETPDTNFESSNPDMHLIKEEGKDKEVYLKFDIQKVKPGIGTATLLVLGNRINPPNPTDKFVVNIFGTDSDEWAETSATWTNKPASGDSPLASYTIADSSIHAIKSVKLTSYINEALDAGRKYLTLVLKGKSATTYRAAIYSKDKIPAALALDYADLTKSVVEDSYVLESLPDSIPDTVTSMRIGKDVANSDSRETYLKFDLRNARAGLVTATLNVKSDQEGSMTKLDNFYIGVHGAENNWQETSLKWNNKPVVGDMLAKYNITKSAVHQITSAELTNYIKQAISNKAEYVSLAIKGVDDTPGSNAWISDKGWVPATLNLDYRQVVASPEFVTKPGDYFPSVTVMINAKTDGSMLYYTIDGGEPTMASLEYTSAGIVLTDSARIKVRGFKDGMAPSAVVEASYNVAPVGLPVFSPNPAVEYQDQVLVTMEISPADAYIVYSDDGSEPLTPYPQDGILLSQSALIKARGVSQDGSYLGKTMEASYKVVNTTPGVGTGPGGIGYKDNTKSGQPENALWLKADALNAADGDKILTLPDMSGNGNDAYNTWVEGNDAGNKIVNTGESQKAPPTYIAEGPNGMPSLNFGIGGTGDVKDLRSLIIDDADNLDGSAGLSLFVVFKRNEQQTDFAAIFQKRNITGGNEQHAYTLEFNGGSDPHKVQMVFNKDLFLRNDYEFKDENYYIINSELNSDYQKTLFSTNGIVEKTSNYSKIVQATDATAILGGFQGMNIAEVILYRKGLNAAQNAIVSNYLSAKYGIDLTYQGATENAKLYTNSMYFHDLIGVGKKLWIDGTTAHEHTWSSGAGLVLKSASSMAVGTFVLAAHNGMEVKTTNNWERHWNVEVSGNNPDVTLGFNFKTVGLEVPTDISAYTLYFDDGTGFADMGINGTKDGNVVNFAVAAIQEGIYTIATSKPGAIAAPVFDPPAGTYTEEKMVTISSATADASIYYTIDGTEPTEASTVYSSPISVSKSTTLKAIAVKDGEKSTVASALYDMNVLGLDDLDKISGIKLYPNPVAERDFNIDLNNEIGGVVRFRVLDYTGKTKTIVFRDMVPGGISQTFHTNGWSDGLYLVEIVQNDTHRTVLKLIKE